MHEPSTSAPAPRWSSPPSPRRSSSRSTASRGCATCTSTSGNDGTSDDHRHLRRRRATRDLAAVDVQNRVQHAPCARLPHEVKSTGVTVNKTSTRHRARGRLLLARTDRYDATVFISNYADLYVRDALKRMRGVGDVRIFGERKYSMRLWLDPARLARRGPHRVGRGRARCASRTSRSPPGRWASAPADAGQTFQISVRALGPADRAATSSTTSCSSAAPNGTLVHLQRRRPRRAGRRGLLGEPALRRPATRWASASSSCPTANALDVRRRRCAPSWPVWRQRFPPG